MHSAKSSISATVDGFFGITAGMTKLLPKAFAPDNIVKAATTRDSKNEADTERNGTLTANITVRVIAVDTVPSRLEMARAQGAEVIDYENEDPVATIRELTGGIGVDRAVDAVGVDANRAHHGPAAKSSKKHAEDFEREYLASSRTVIR